MVEIVLFKHGIDRQHSRCQGFESLMRHITRFVFRQNG
ncbi:Uncharacterised protein [Vibrio cholerae]|nr:Uncharacterised protein [Vibrio cholerae]